MDNSLVPFAPSVASANSEVLWPATDTTTQHNNTTQHNKHNTTNTTQQHNIVCSTLPLPLPLLCRLFPPLLPAAQHMQPQESDGPALGWLIDSRARAAAGFSANDDLGLQPLRIDVSSRSVIDVSNEQFGQTDDEDIPAVVSRQRLANLSSRGM